MSRKNGRGGWTEGKDRNEPQKELIAAVNDLISKYGRKAGRRPAMDDSLSITRVALAEYLGVTFNAVANWLDEKKNPSPNRVEQMQQWHDEMINLLEERGLLE